MDKLSKTIAEVKERQRKGLLKARINKNKNEKVSFPHYCHIFALWGNCKADQNSCNCRL